MATLRLAECLTALCTVLLCLWLAVGLGVQAMRALHVRSRHAGLDTGHAIGLGLGLMAYILWLVSAFKLFHRSFLHLVAAGLAVWALPGALHWIRSTWGRIRRAWTQRPTDLISYIVCAQLGVALVLVTATALTPPIARDALKYHLFLPRMALDTGHLSPIPGNFYTYFPAIIQLLYGFCLSLGTETAPALLHTVCAVLTGVALYALARTWIAPRHALWACLLWTTTPVVMQVAGWAYVDVAYSWFVLLTLAALFEWRTTARYPFVVLAGIHAGLAMACKYHGLIPAVLAVVFLLWTARQRAVQTRRPQRAPWVIFSMIVTIVAGPWYLRNWIATGNPVYPFLYSWFGGPEWDLTRAHLYQQFLRAFGLGYSPWDALMLPWRLSVLSHVGWGNFDGVLGAAHLIATPTALLVSSFPGPWQLLSGWVGLYGLVWFSSSQQLRFLMPVLLGTSLCGAMGVATAEWRSKSLYRAVTISVILATTWNLWQPLLQLHHTRGALYLSGLQSRTDYLRANIRAYAVLEYINRELPQQATIFMVHAGNIAYYCRRSLIQDTVFEEHTFLHIIRSARTPNEIAVALRTQGAHYVLIDEQAGAEFIQGALSPPLRERYHQFREQHFTPLYGANGYVLYQLRPEQPSA